MDTLLARLSDFKSRYPTTDDFREAWFAYDQDDNIPQDSPFHSLVKACFKVSVTISKDWEVVFSSVSSLLSALWEMEDLRAWMVASAKKALAAFIEGRLEKAPPAFTYAAVSAAVMVGHRRFTDVTSVWIRRDPEKQGILEDIMSLAGNDGTVDLETTCDQHTELEEVVDFFTFLPAFNRLQWLSVCNLISPSRSDGDFGVLEVMERMYEEHARLLPLEIEVTNCLVSSDATVVYSEYGNVKRPFKHESDAMLVTYSPQVRQWPKIVSGSEDDASSDSSKSVHPLQELVQQLCVLSCMPNQMHSESISVSPGRIDTSWLAKRFVEVLHETGQDAVQFLTDVIKISDPYDINSFLEVQLASVRTTETHANMLSTLRLGGLLLQVLTADELFEGRLNLLSIDNLNHDLAKSGNLARLYLNVINNANYNLMEQRERIFNSEANGIDWRNMPEEHMDNEILDGFPRLQGEFISEIGPVVGTTLYSIGRDNRSRMDCKNRDRTDAFIAKVINGEIAVYRNKSPMDFARRHIPIEEVGIHWVHLKISPQAPGARLSPDEVVAALLAGSYGPVAGRWALSKIHELGLAAKTANACYLSENAKRDGGKIDPRVQLGSNVFNNITLILSGKSVFYSTNGTTMRKVIDKGRYFHIDEVEVPVDMKGQLCRVVVSKPVG